MRHDLDFGNLDRCAALCGSLQAAPIVFRSARWHLPGDGPQPYAVYVDETDAVWVSDWGANAILRFDPKTEKVNSFSLPDRYTGARQLAGRKGEAWGAESGVDKLFVLKTE